MKKNVNLFVINRKGVFIRWQSKGYSVFSSLQRIVCIAVLPLVYFSTMGKTVNAQIDTIQLQEIIINENRAPATYSEMARIVHVISRSEIEKAPVQSISDLLEYAANVDVRQRGAGDVQSDISIKGGTFEQVLILLNGVRINDTQTGHHNLNLPIDLENIERIEILEGPGTQLYGANAFSGAINIITTSGTSPGANAVLAAGPYGYLTASVALSFRISNLSNYISFNYKKSDGYATNTDYKVGGVFYQAGYSRKTTSVQLQTGFQTKNFGAYNFYTPVYPNQFESVNAIYGSLVFQTGKTLKTRTSVYGRRHTDRFELFRESDNWYTKTTDGFFVMGTDTARFSKTSFYQRHNYHLTNMYGTDINTSYAGSFGTVSVGAEYRFDDIRSTNLGENSDTLAINNVDDVWYTKQKSRQNFSLYTNYQYAFNKFNLAAGVIGNLNSDFNPNVNGGIELSYRIINGVKLFSSVNQSFRMPTFTDIYYSSGDRVGNPELVPEKAITYEAGVKLKYKKFGAHFSVFQRNGYDMIDWVKLPADIKFKSENIVNVNLRGIDFQLAYNPGKSFVTNVSIAYSYMEMDKESGDYSSLYLLDYLKHKTLVKVQHKIAGKLSASWRLTWYDREGNFNVYNKVLKTYTGEIPYEPVLLLDGRLQWSDTFFDLFIDGTNLTNTTYNDIGNVQLPGIALYAGIRLHFINNKNKR